MTHPISLPTPLIRVLTILIVLLLPIVIIISSVRLLVTDQYLAFEYSKTDFPADIFGFTSERRFGYASDNFRYVRDDQPLAVLADQQKSGVPVYNERELKHMQDVQNVYQSVWRAWRIALSIIFLAGLALAWRSETRRALAIAITWGGLLTAILVALVGVLAVAAWRVWFVAFHQIFFVPGTWMFSYADTLIRLFPEKFWFDAALTISGLSLLAGVLLALLGWGWRVRQQADGGR